MIEQFRDPVFKGCFALCVGDFKEVVEYLRDRDFDTADMGPKLAKTLLLKKDGASEVLIWFQPDFSLRPECLGVLAHEALHAVHFMLQDRGMSSGSILDEVGNYYIEWLVREIANLVTRFASPDQLSDTQHIDMK